MTNSNAITSNFWRHAHLKPRLLLACILVTLTTWAIQQPSQAQSTLTMRIRRSSVSWPDTDRGNDHHRQSRSAPLFHPSLAPDLATPEGCKAEMTWLVVTFQDSLPAKYGHLSQK